MSRHPTPPPVPSADLNFIRLDGMERRIADLSASLSDVQEEMEELAKVQIEVCGRSGSNGRLGVVAKRVEDSAESQGRRIGNLEVEVGKLRQARAQLYVIAAIGMVVLGALVKVLLE